MVQRTGTPRPSAHVSWQVDQLHQPGILPLPPFQVDALHADLLQVLPGDQDVVRLERLAEVDDRLAARLCLTAKLLIVEGSRSKRERQAGLTRVVSAGGAPA